jgi:ADP-ribose pyrophosphatase YjhB (NUDIX family)
MRDPTQDGKPRWIGWAQRLQTAAQAGLTYSRDPFDRERFTAMQLLAAEIMAEHTDATTEEMLAMLRAEPGYVTPKVDVRAAVFDGGRILLVRETADGRWSLPGGWADIGESAGEIAAREVLEETGYEVRPTKLLAVLDKAKHGHPTQIFYVYKLFFRCELLGGASRTSIETSEVAWFGEHELPPLSLDRNMPSQVARMFAHEREQDLPTDFD